MVRPTILAAWLAMVLAAPSLAQETFEAQVNSVTEWKAVYGQIEARDRIPARARLGGTLVRLDVSEGDQVEAGQPLGQVVDEKIDFQLAALDAQLQVIEAQLGNARTELKRGEELLDRGVTTVQRLDGLRTQVDVLSNQIESLRAERRVIEQRTAEGTVLSPLAGRVLDVPVAVGAVVMPGEVVALVGGGGFFLRLAIPERHAASLTEGDVIEIEETGAVREGRLVRIYPQIENGRVVADVEVADLSDAFVGKRLLVRLPVGQRDALMVPLDMVFNHSGLDFVEIEGAHEAGADESSGWRTVLLGQRHDVNGVEMVEIVAGLEAGETVVEHDG